MRGMMSMPHKNTERGKKDFRQSIIDAWEMFNDEDISTWCLLALISDLTGANIDEICSVMVEESEDMNVE
jgi:hypothetical protein